jgi:hypothetical protein
MLRPRGGLEDLIGISIRLGDFRLLEQPQGFFRLTLCSPYVAPFAVREIDQEMSKPDRES